MGRRTRKKKKKISQAEKNALKNQTVMAFRYRNVFKFILRNMYDYTKAHREELRRLLKDKGYKDTEIELTFAGIEGYKSKGYSGGIVVKPKIKIDEMVQAKSINTIILRLSLILVLEKLEKQEFKQMYETNRLTYIEGCRMYLKKANEALDGEVKTETNLSPQF